MITFRIWNVLSKPQRYHPLYRRAQMPRQLSGWVQAASETLGAYVPIVFLLASLAMCCALSARMGFLLAAAAIVLLFNATVYAVNWSMRISGEVASVRKSGEWELLCLIPQGAIGAAWVLATGVSNRENHFERQYNRHVIVLAILLGLFALTVPCALTIYSSQDGPAGLFLLGGYALAALFVSYVDYVQSAALGSLIGILGGLQTSSALDAEFWAGGVFLALQAAIYALIVLVCFVLLPPIPTEISGPELPLQLALLAFRVLFFIGLREAIVVVAWRQVAERLQTTTHDLIALGQAS
jgi:hypothetical protein